MYTRTFLGLKVAYERAKYAFADMNQMTNQAAVKNREKKRFNKMRRFNPVLWEYAETNLFAFSK